MSSILGFSNLAIIADFGDISTPVTVYLLERYFASCPKPVPKSKTFAGGCTMEMNSSSCVCETGLPAYCSS